MNVFEFFELAVPLLQNICWSVFYLMCIVMGANVIITLVRQQKK